MLRLATFDDAEAIAAIYRPYVEDSAISFETISPSTENMRQRIENTVPTYPWLVATDDAELVCGYAYAGAHRARDAYRWSADVSIYLANHAQGRGLGRQLYTALLELLRRQGYANAFAGIALPNVASVRLHESMGFSHLGTYRNVGYKNDAGTTSAGGSFR